MTRLFALVESLRGSENGLLQLVRNSLKPWCAGAQKKLPSRPGNASSCTSKESRTERLTRAEGNGNHENGKVKTIRAG